MFPLGSFSELVEANPKLPVKRGDEHDFVGMENVIPGRRYVRTTEMRPFKGGGAKFQSGDTLFARITPCLENGKIAQAIIEGDFGFGSTEFFVLRAKPGISNPAFIFYLSTTPWVRAPAEKSMAGASGRQRAGLGSVLSAEVPLPPLPTQQRIAAILSAYDDLIENNARRITILEEMARRLYDEWFVHFRFPGHETAEFEGDLPSGWTEVPLGTVASVTWGDTKTTKRSYVDDGYVAYSAAGPDGFLPHFDYDRTGIVLSAIGAKCGLTWFARGKWSCIKNTIRLFSTDQAVSDEYLFFTTGFSAYWPKRGSAQPFISQGDAKQCKVVVPPETLHERFLSIARPALQQAGQLRLTNANLRAQRDLLLPKLVSGEIDVNGAEAALEAAE